MSGRDWDAELKKIDKQMESVADEAILPAPAAGTPAAKAEAAKAHAATSTIGVFSRLVLAVLLGIAMIFWPYSARCGIGLAGYLGAVIVLVIAGVWSSIWTWRHRAGRAHLLALLLAVWGIILGAIEILPRTGYAVPTPQHPAAWMCQ